MHKIPPLKFPKILSKNLIRLLPVFTTSNRFAKLRPRVYDFTTDLPLTTTGKMTADGINKRMDSDKSQMNFGNTLDEIKYVRSILFEIGPEPSDTEIDRAITLAKVDMFQDKMEKFYDPEMVGNGLEIN